MLNLLFAVGAMFFNVEPAFDTLLMESMFTGEFDGLASFFKLFSTDGATM